MKKGQPLGADTSGNLYFRLGSDSGAHAPYSAHIISDSHFRSRPCVDMNAAVIVPRSLWFRNLHDIRLRGGCLPIPSFSFKRGLQADPVSLKPLNRTLWGMGREVGQYGQQVGRSCLFFKDRMLELHELPGLSSGQLLCPGRDFSVHMSVLMPECLLAQAAAPPSTDPANLGKQEDGYRAARFSADGVALLREQLLALLQGARFWDKSSDWMQVCC